MRIILGIVALALLGLATNVLADPPSNDPDSLWKSVSLLCVPNEQEFHNPDPCEKVDLVNAYAVFKSTPNGTDRLLIPTKRLPGVENTGSPANTTKGLPADVNYWRFAWEARLFVFADLKGQGRLEPARDEMGMAINAASRRSQGQLHIHVDCVTADVVKALRAREKTKGWVVDKWQEDPFVDPGRASYRVMRVNGADLSAVDPSRRVSDNLPPNGAPDRAFMALHTIVVVGVAASSDHPEGFYILDNVASQDATIPSHGSGERLLDHTCALSKAK